MYHQIHCVKISSLNFILFYNFTNCIRVCIYVKYENNEIYYKLEYIYMDAPFCYIMLSERESKLF